MAKTRRSSPRIVLDGFKALGFAGGASVDDPAVSRAFCGESEQVLCWVVCGRPKRAAHPRYPAAPVAPLSDWGGPEGH